MGLRPFLFGSVLIMPKASLLAFAALAVLSRSLFAAEPFPAFHANDVILFQGDSITDGGRARSGDDHNHIMGQDYAYVVAGWVGSECPERHLTFINRGIGGQKVGDLALRWQNDTLDLKPTIVSILVGINDAMRHTPVAAYERTYDKMLAETVAALPGVRLVLCTPFILPTGRAQTDFAVSQANVKQLSAVVEKLAVKYHAPVVRLQPILDEACKRAPAGYWLWDGIHPDYAGHYLLAQEWVRTVDSFYGAAASPAASP